MSGIGTSPLQRVKKSLAYGILGVIAIFVIGCDLGRRELSPLPSPTALAIEDLPSETSQVLQDTLYPASIAGSLLLSLDEVNRLAGGGVYKTGESAMQSPVTMRGEMNPPECQPVLHALQNKAVGGSAYTVFRFVLFPHAENPGEVFEEGFALYPDLNQTSVVYKKIAVAVEACKDTDISEKQEGAEDAVTFHVEVQDQQAASLHWTAQITESESAVRCVFDVKMKKNLITEIVECGPNPGELTSQVSDELSQRMG